MTIQVTHKHVSPKSDGSDTTLIQPSDWNDTHTLVGSLGALLGFDGTTGAAVEVTVDGTTITRVGNIVGVPDGAISMAKLATALQTLINAKAPLASPALTGTPTAPTPAAGTNSTRVATTEFVERDFAPLDSAALTGTPTAPTPATSDNTTKIATSALVHEINGMLEGVISVASSRVCTAADFGALIRGTAASAAITLPAASGNTGQTIYTQAYGAYTGVTISTAGGNLRLGASEASTYTHVPGEVIQWVSDGSRWNAIASMIPSGTGAYKAVVTDSAGRLPALDGSLLTGITGVAVDYQAFTASGTWTKPAGVSANALVFAMIWGAGAGGATSIGGGGGACQIAFWRAGQLAATEAVTVGSGGAAGAVGGNSSFNGAVGYGGGKGANGVGGGAGGGWLSTGGLFSGAGAYPTDTAPGGAGSFGGGGGGYGSLAPGASVFGGGGGSGLSGTLGGTSVFGGAGGSNGVAATAPGGGGYISTAGARGEVRVWTIG